MKKSLLLTAAVLLGCSACGGGGGGVAATAKPGDAFCTLAKTAKDDHDELVALDETDSAKVKIVLTAAVDSLDKAVAKAPKDIATTAQTLLYNQLALETLLKKYDYDVVALAKTDEWQTFQANDVSAASDEFDAYLSNKCGLVTVTVPDDTTPVESTPLETLPVESVPPGSQPTDTAGASGDTTVDTLVDLGEGSAAINKFLDYFEVGNGTKLTDEQRKCVVDYLVDKVTGSQLNQILAGNTLPDVEETLGTAFIGCHVETG